MGRIVALCLGELTRAEKAGRFVGLSLRRAGLNGTVPMDGLARERLGRINPEVLADLLKLTPEQRRQMVRQLSGLEANSAADGTIPVEVAMRAAQRAKDAEASSDLA